MPDKAWKRLERTIGKLFGGERVKRMGDFSVSATDVILHDLRHIKIDCKLRQRFMHHSLFNEINERYCKNDGEIPLLVTKEYGKYRYLVSVDAEFFAVLLDAYREKLKAQNGNITAIRPSGRASSNP
jgi:hypothetical protein